MRVKTVLAAVVAGLLFSGCAVEVDGNEAGLECSNGNAPVGNICPTPATGAAENLAKRPKSAKRDLCPPTTGPKANRFSRGTAALQKYLPKNQRCVPRPSKTRTPEPDLDAYLLATSGGRHCLDVTSYDYNWDNDVLCTRADGTQFYTSYEGARSFLGY